MPSRQKVAYFMACACCTSVSVAILGFAMSQTWAESSLECSQGDDFFNGSALIIWELFSGQFQRRLCPQLGTQYDFDVFTELRNSGAPVILYAVVVFSLVVCMATSALSILIAFYNSVSNPYQTYLGPMGVYVCSSISAVLSVVVLILYALTVTLTNIAETVVLNQASGSEVNMQNRAAVVQLGYYLVIPYTVLSLAAIAMVYLYDHAAYTQRREQQRPTEDAPKEIMMY